MNTAVMMVAATFTLTAGFNLNLIADYLVENHLKICLFLSCEDERANFKSLRMVQQSGIWANSYDISNGIDNIDVDKLFFYLNYHVAVIIDLDCSSSGVVLKEMSQRTLFHHRYYWLMFATNLTTAYELLEHENINVDAEITLAIPLFAESSSSRYQLFDVYNHSYQRGGKLNITFMSSWHSNIGLMAAPRPTKHERRRNFGGLTLKGVLTISEIPRNYTLQEDLETTDYAYLDSMNRFNYRLFELMKDVHNFKIFLYRSRYWGFTVNGTWVGSIGFIVRKEVDVCVTSLRWSPERYGFYEPTTNTYNARVLFVFRHPKFSIDASNIFLVPFNRNVWICTVVFGSALAYALRYIFCVENHRKVKMHVTRDNSGNEISWSNSFLIIFGIFFQQGFSASPVLTSARVVTLCTLIFSILLFQFYSSFIVGSLLTEPPKNIKTIQQLLDSHLDCGIDEVSYNKDVFDHATDPVAIKLYKQKILSKNNFFPLDTGLEMIRKGGFAFHTDVSSTYIKLKTLFNDQEICDLQEVAYAKPFPCAPAVPLMSPLQELIKINIRRMYETGLHAYHSAIWEMRKPKCAKSELDVAPVDFEHFSSALFILFIGMSVSVSILIVEIIVHRAKNRKGNGQFKFLQ